MDQGKIGKFIAELRKEKKLTQRALADQLLISEKTVSKWECGKGLPEVSCMMPLCKILGISVNELLSGERISKETYYRKAEENMVNLLKEKEESKKKIWISIINAMIGLCVLCGCILLVEYGQIHLFWLKVALIVFGIVVFLCSIFVAVVLDISSGSYECPHCHERFVPSTSAYIMGRHTLKRRYLTCPHCGKKGYCIKRLTK